MEQPFIGAIFAHCGTFAPVDWEFCNGRTLDISQNQTLYTLIGTIYGGDGNYNFNLPDLRGRVPVCQGTGTGMNPCIIGQSSGSETVTLSGNEVPPHSHSLKAHSAAGNVTVPVNGSTIAATYSGEGKSAEALNFYSATAPATTLVNTTISPYPGGGSPIPIVQPLLAVNYIIALFGLYPPRA